MHGMALYTSRMQFQNLGWRGWLGLIVFGAVGLAAAVALIVLSLGLAIVLVPVVAIAVVIGRWRLRKMMADVEKQRAGQPGAGRTIEIDYTVVDGDDRRGR